MKLNPPRKVRAALYIFTAVGSFVVTGLALYEIVGAKEVTLWTSFTVLIATMAGRNTIK